MKTDSRLILVADDSSLLREALAVPLENSGYEVAQASDGSAAIAVARERPVALLITDLVMPGREGFETIRQFNQEFPLIPVIAMSGNYDYLAMAKKLGAADVLAKPIKSANLLDAVRKLVL